MSALTSRLPDHKYQRLKALSRHGGTSMKRLLDLPVRIVHGGHYPSFGQDRMREIARDFLAQFDR